MRSGMKPLVHGHREARRVTMFVANDMRLDSRVRREAATLAEAGDSVTVYAVLGNATIDQAHEFVDGFSIIRVPMLTRPSPDPVRVREGTVPLRPISVPRMAVSAFVATRPMLGGSIHFLLNWRFRWRSWGRRVEALVVPADIWHAHDLNTLSTALACARRHGGQVVYDSHEIFTEAGANALLPLPVRRFLRRLERSWAQRCDAIVTVNESVASHLRDALQIARIAVVHNCATPPVAGTSPLRSWIGLTDAVPLVLYHGNITFSRGLEPLIAAMTDARMEGIHLALMGYGPLRPRLQALAAASSATQRIHFLPPVSPNELTKWVAGADVAAMPIEPTTLNHRLSSPNKLFEALAAGVPVVGPDFAEFRRIVLEGAWGPLGTLHAGHAPGQLVDALLDVIDRSDVERAALRDRCREAARTRWSWDHERDRLLAVYDALARQSVLVSPQQRPPLTALASTRGFDG
jgi:glycosyltransferase involved in cell wall biosynthesis